MTDLLTLFRAEGIRVREIGDWRSRVRPGTFTPDGVMVHATADKGQGDSGLSVLINGREDLNGPLCNASPRDDGSLALISAGRANHAGKGNRSVWDRIRHDLAPRGLAAALGLKDDMDGANGLYYGLEVDNANDGSEPYSPETYDTTVRACTALVRHHGWTANRVLLHSEHTRRKTDWNLSGTDLRAAVALRLRTAVLIKGVWTVPPPVIVPDLTEIDMFLMNSPTKHTSLITADGRRELKTTAERKAWGKALAAARKGDTAVLTDTEFGLITRVLARPVAS